MKLKKYVEELEIKPLYEVTKKVREESEEVRKAFAHYVVTMLFDELKLNFENIITILEIIKFHELINIQMISGNVLMDMLLDVINRIKKQ